MIHLPITDGRRLEISPANYPINNYLDDIIAGLNAWSSQVERTRGKSFKRTH
jgi:hypothetical protein